MSCTRCRARPLTLRRVQSGDGGRGCTSRMDAVNRHQNRRRLVGLFNRMALATAAELIGVSQRMLELAVDYVKVRQQFGQAVGSFQAVKHLLADALLELELARPLVYHAATRRRPSSISMAKAAAGDAAHTWRARRCSVMARLGTVSSTISFVDEARWALESAWGSRCGIASG